MFVIATIVSIHLGDNNILCRRNAQEKCRDCNLFPSTLYVPFYGILWMYASQLPPCRKLNVSQQIIYSSSRTHLFAHTSKESITVITFTYFSCSPSKRNVPVIVFWMQSCGHFSRRISDKAFRGIRNTADRQRWRCFS